MNYNSVIYINYSQLLFLNSIYRSKLLEIQLSYYTWMGNLLHSQSPNITVQFGREGNGKKCNYIETTKYSFITFIPKSLLLQFIRPANYVYLVAAIAQSIPAISSLSPITAIAPLIFVLAVALVKEAIEDFKRFRKDRETNAQPTQLLSQAQFIPCRWDEIYVGDIIKIKENEMVPADVILLHSSQENSICYVQTSNLDGQSNLKTKSAFVENIRVYPNQFQVLHGNIVVESPNSNLHDFNGLIRIDDHQEKPITIENLLIRGCVLKNTDHVVGIVVYAGHDTKIMKNQGQIKHKISIVQRRVNIIQLILLVALFLLSLSCSIGYYYTHTAYQDGSRKDFFYLPKSVGRNMVYESVLIFFTSFLLLNFLIPVSMNIALEGVKIFQGMWINFDKKMFYEPLNQGCSTLNMSIIQQLGMVDYVLTDKTGTLTANEMKFRFSWINGKKYNASDLIIKNQTSSLLFTNMGTQSLILDSIQQIQMANFREFWQAVIICHDVVVDTEKQQFQGSSPDQVCFVEFAKKIGYVFVKRTKNYIELKIQNEKVIYEFLNIFPFSPRKRMSVIVRNIETQQITMFTKGADNSVLSKSLDFAKKDDFQDSINQFAKQGFRTLAFAKRSLNRQQYQHFVQKNKEINCKKLLGLNKQIMEVSSKAIIPLEYTFDDLVQSMQQKLRIIGASAIQDSLQDQVPETIARLQEAGITVMMITGDKLQTAQNIGYLSNFIDEKGIIFKIRSTQQNTQGQIQKIDTQIKTRNIDNYSLIIQGDSIERIVTSKNPMTVQLIKNCKSTIFCRSTPKEKASIVQFVKNQLGGIVLAIGDGGNDIGMIQEANIGIGLIGKQGNQAASSSDFYFAQFKFLDRLILHHGRWSYYRMAYFFVYYGWKNLTMTLILFYFLIYSAFSGLPAVSESFITGYNSIIALYILMCYSIWDQDINSDTYPQAYALEPRFYLDFKKLDLFSYKRYILWSFLGILLSFYIHFSFIYILGGTFSVSADGYPADYKTYASGVALILTLVSIFIVKCDFNSYTGLTLFFLIVGNVIPVTLYFIFQQYIVGYHFDISDALMDNLCFRYWATIVILSAPPILIKAGWNHFMFTFMPNSVQLQIQNRQQKKFLGQLGGQTMVQFIQK